MLGAGVRTGADFEAGRTHWRNERVDGAERSTGRDPEEGFDIGTTGRRGTQRQRGIDSFLGGRDPEVVDEGDFVNGRQVRQKKVWGTKVVTFGGPGPYHGKELTVCVSDQAAEDSRWVLILDKKDSGQRKYLCVRCGGTFTGKPGRVLSHCLRISGEQVNICTKTLPVELSDTLHRLRRQSQSPASKAGQTAAAARTPSVASGFSSLENKTAGVDEALAKLICSNDLSYATV